ncbi:hypothetical protein M0Q28_00325 [Patescibacteria group bacterium]|jgi:hypothetical protein|nr:hypothetical protein [Patescibacteria group bacterium]
MTTKRFLIGLASSSLLFAPLLGHAAGCTSGTLIKGSLSSVYYCGADGKRYVFPNEKVYNTWYAGFDSVQTISDSELASLPLGGNVTYRPGLKMVKINTDPKVYAVAAGGTLRWVQTESVARDLYGADWNTKIDDIADTYFVNYRIGNPIPSAGEYSVANELALSTSINRDRNLEQPTTPPPAPTPTTTTSTPPAPTPTRTGTLSATPEEPSINQTITLIASAQPSTGLWYINIFWNGILTRHCEYSPCGADVQTGTGTSSIAVAEFVWGDQYRAWTTSTILTTAGSPGVTLTITNPEIKPDTQREIIVDVDSSFVANTIDIFLDGNNVRGCNVVQQCRYTGLETSPIGTVHTAYGVIRDANGFTRQTSVESFEVVSNPRPVVTITPGKNSMLRGETVDVSVSASDDDGIAFTEITESDGTLIKRCESSFCTAQVMRPTAGTFRFIGRAGDIPGMIGTATSSAVVVQ